MSEIERWNTQFNLEENDADWIDPDDFSTWRAVFGSPASIANPQIPSNYGADAELKDSDGPSGPMPPMADDGDGLKTIEEYRGFILDGGPSVTEAGHHRFSVARKVALFAFLVLPEIQDASNPSNRANAVAKEFDPMVSWQGVMEFFRKPYEDGGADLDSYMVLLPLVVDETETAPTPDGGIRPAYLYDTDLQTISNSTRPDQARTYIYVDSWLLGEDAGLHAQIYAQDAQTARSEAFRRAHQGAESLVGFGMLNKFTTTAFYNRFGGYLQEPHWSSGVVEYINTSFSNHLSGGSSSHPMIDPTPKHRGIQFAINSISEVSLKIPSIQDFNNRLEWAIAHEIGHALIWARAAGHPAPEPGLVSQWIPPDQISLGPVIMQAEEIQLIDLRNRLSTIK